ncbi:MAG: hypothetical protein OEY64_12420 [Nitrospinota bacterium]|nr:hypothetical protein [Nitrospinota bacterium]
MNPGFSLSGPLLAIVILSLIFLPDIFSTCRFGARPWNTAFAVEGKTSEANINLEGIVYHSDKEKRSATIRLAGEKDARVYRIGDDLRKYKLLRIEESSVTLYDGDQLRILRIEPVVIDISGN